MNGAGVLPPSRGMTRDVTHVNHSPMTTRNQDPGGRSRGVLHLQLNLDQIKLPSQVREVRGRLCRLLNDVQDGETLEAENRSEHSDVSPRGRLLRFPQRGIAEHRYQAILNGSGSL